MRIPMITDGQSYTPSSFQAHVPGGALQSPPELAAGRALFIFIIFYVGQVVVGFTMGVLAGVYYAATRGSTDLTVLAEMQRTIAVPASLVGTVLAGLVVLRMTRRSLPGPMKSGALSPIGWSGASARHLASGLVLGFGLSLAYLFVLVPSFPPAPDQAWGPLVRAAQAGGWSRHGWAFLALFAAPPVEELVFRGVLFSGFSRSWGSGLSGTLVTVIFVAAHFTEVFAYWPALVSLGLVGVTTLLIRISTKSLAPAIFVHASYNLVLVLSVYAGAA
jgi:membrane protease YdiL (CAAX protease family)